MLKQVVAFLKSAPALIFYFIKDREFAVFTGLFASLLLESEAVLSIVALELSDIEFHDWRSLVPAIVGLLVRFNVFSRQTNDEQVSAAAVEGFIRGLHDARSEGM